MLFLRSDDDDWTLIASMAWQKGSVGKSPPLSIFRRDRTEICETRFFLNDGEHQIIKRFYSDEVGLLIEIWRHFLSKIRRNSDKLTISSWFGWLFPMTFVNGPHTIDTGNRVFPCVKFSKGAFSKSCTIELDGHNWRATFDEFEDWLNRVEDFHKLHLIK